MKKILIIIILYCFISDGFAQIAGERKVYSLQQCIEFALKKNYDIQSSEAQLKSTDAQIRAAFGNYLPSLNYNLGYSRQLNVKGGQTVNVGGQIIPIAGQNPNSYNMGAYATFDIFDGFYREAAYNRAQDNNDIASLNLQQIQKNVVLDVYRGYISIVRNAQIIKIRQDNINVAKAELERIQAQYNAGLVPISNVYAQEAEIGNRELDLVSSENDFNVAKANLLTTMGLLPDTDVDFLESSVPSKITDRELQEFRSAVGSMNACIKQALENRHDFSAAQTGIDAASSGVTIAKSGYFPKLSAQGGWSWSDNTIANTNFSDKGRSYVSLNFSLPIFDNFGTNAQIQNAKYQQTQKEFELLQLEQSIRKSVQTAYLTLEAAEKQIDITQRTLKFSEQNYESNKERYSVGATQITEYQIAANQLLSAQINRVTAVYNYIQAQKSLLYAMGRL